MLELVIGLVVFFAIHLVPTAEKMRSGIIERFGALPYKIAFSVLSLAGFALIVKGYHKIQVDVGKNVVLWDAPTWLNHVTWLLMLPAMIFLVAAYIPSRIRTALKHPMLVAIKTWALAHLIVNGDLASLALFGSFLAYAVYDRISLKHRVTGGLGPLGTATGGLVGDLLVLVIGTALYLFMLYYGHAVLIGKPLLPAS